MQLPTPEEYPFYYRPYIELVGGQEDVLEFLREQEAAIRYVFTEEVPLEKENHAYEEGKWTIKELFGHIIDTERIMSTRVLCIARGETQSLPGFDENTYVENARFSERTMLSLVEEFAGLRAANLALFSTLQEEDLTRQGIANGKPVTPRAIIYIIAGHAEHHLKVLRERYLVE